MTRVMNLFYVTILSIVIRLTRLYSV
jgi:hypothetical protein